MPKPPTFAAVLELQDDGTITGSVIAARDFRAGEVHELSHRSGVACKGGVQSIRLMLIANRQMTVTIASSTPLSNDTVKKLFEQLFDGYGEIIVEWPAAVEIIVAVLARSGR